MAGGEVQENTITSLRVECQSIATEILIALREISAMPVEEAKATGSDAPDYPTIPSNISGLMELRATLRTALDVLMEGIVRKIK